ncbi:MAG: holo-ACP synthase [Selenomonadaceae bacterium]|nr:holo-ACP synthase [Selenomonadaceae bacterium]
MVLGIGTDIIEISRVKRAIESEHFRARVYTAAERAYCEARGAGMAASFAARFAGKEAVLKAFGTGLRGGSLQDVEILDDALGCPRVTLHGYYQALAAEQGVTRILLSLSHAREYATAQCVMEGAMEGRDGMEGENSK